MEKNIINTPIPIKTRTPTPAPIKTRIPTPTPNEILGKNSPTCNGMFS